jgi:hypothetical protein
MSPISLSLLLVVLLVVLIIKDQIGVGKAEGLAG